MQLTDRDRRASLVAWAEKLAKLATDYGQPATAQTVRQASEQFETAPFRLAVLGKVKRGKSTLINALLGRQDDTVAPIDKLPASSAISSFRRSDLESAKIFFRDGHTEVIPYAAIRDYVTEEGNPENRKEVALVEVSGNFPNLDRHVELIDTPGAGSLHEYHDALLHQFIPQADAVVFLVTARMPLDQDELALLEKLKQADIQKIFFAINRIDESTPADIDAAVDHNRSALAKLNIPVTKMYRVSAKRAFSGDLPGSQLAPLIADVRAFLAEHKGQVLEDRFRSRVLQAVQPLAQAIAVEISSASKSSAELVADQQRLVQERQRIEASQKPAEADFERQWRRALSEFERELDDVEARARTTVACKIAETSLFEVNALVQELPTLIQRQVETELQPVAGKLETRLQTVAQKLQQEYPRLELGFMGMHSRGTDFADQPVKEIAGGLASVAVGSGLMFAGQAAASSIAAANAAAIAAATTTVSAPSLLSALGTSLLPEAAGIFSFLGAGTATVSAPVALTTTPLWVAMSGPVGWTLVGLGVAAVPFAWRVSKLKTRQKLEEAAETQVATIFERLRKNRIAQLREMGTDIVDEFRAQNAGQLEQLETTLREVLAKRPDEARIRQLQETAAKLESLLLGPATRGEGP
ncbi:dynamin family protein [Anatilimnocola sp. NA78]|uniref:dynamin family protein n=1 Tax=Anatilimnocola sp. NA78 TaxID=3415683 RepID=UPI003CE53285